MKAAQVGLVALGMALVLAGCGTSWDESRPAVGHYKVGKPYRIGGRWYRPEYDPTYDRVGTASWYGHDFDGLPTANGEVFDKDRITAAHPTLPLPSRVRVTNLANGRSLELRVNDRGPFVDGRLIDLSQAAARKLGFERQGLTDVRVQFLELADARGTPPVPPTARTVPGRSTPRTEPARPTPRAPPSDLAQAAAERPIRVAALAVPAPAGRRSCPSDARFVQVGAFAETDTMHAAIESVVGLQQIRVEPAYVGNRAVARLRLGPVANDVEALTLLDQVRALGYAGAFLTTAGGSSVAAC